MDFKDYYKILGVDRKAELKTIKTAYRRLARKYHPDVSTDPDAENNFKAIAEAYAVLKDADKRVEYDALFEQVKNHQYRSTQQANSTRNAAPQNDFSDFFESVINQSHASSWDDDIYHEHSGYQGQDVDMTLAISLEEALLGSSKTISFKLPSAKEAKKLKIVIPPETQQGDLIRLKGQGLPSINKQHAGDIYLRIKYEPHSDFDLEGLDLILTVPISPWEAALGAKIIIPTLTSKISLTVPPDSQTGQRLRIKNKGLKSKQKQGDLFVVFKVIMPDKNNAEMNRIWQSMKGKFDFNPRSKWSQ